MAQPAQRYPQQADFALAVAMLPKQRNKNSECVGIKLHWIIQRLGSSVSIEPSIANGQRQSPRRQSRLSQSLARVLRNMAAHRLHRLRIVGVFAKSMVLRDRFGLGIHNEFIRIAAPRFAIDRKSTRLN